MKYIVDTHLHIYPFYSINRALESLINNPHNAAPDSIKVGCLTERYDCDVFNQLLESPPADVTDTFAITNSGNCLHIVNKKTGKDVHLLPGQHQVQEPKRYFMKLVLLQLPAQWQDVRILTHPNLPVVPRQATHHPLKYYLLLNLPTLWKACPEVKPHRS